MKRPHTVPVLLATALALGGCSLIEQGAHDYLGPGVEASTPILERGSFEDARTRLDAMVDQIATEMTTAFPDCPPMQRDSDPDNITGGGTPKNWVSGARPYEMTSQARIMKCTIADTRERADTAIEIVTRIADDYDFEPRIVFVEDIAPEGAGNVDFEGWAPDGDKYSFGSGKYTVVDYTTGLRFTAEQLDAIEHGQTPPQPAPTSLATTTPTSQGRRRRRDDEDDLDGPGRRPTLGPELIV